MYKLISLNQSFFLKERMLVDGVVVVNEVVYFDKRSKRFFFIIKVDFEKAYDSVSWNFLDYMLTKFGFSEKWMSWMRACIFVGNLAVMINGCSNQEINIQMGLKQGNPQAPFLFLLVFGGLIGLVVRDEETGLYFGFRVETFGFIGS